MGGALGGTISEQERQGNGVAIPSLEDSGSLIVCLDQARSKIHTPDQNSIVRTSFLTSYSTDAMKHQHLRSQDVITIE